MTRQKQIIVHIGLPKTGTTTLQSYFERLDFYVGKNPNMRTHFIHMIRYKTGLVKPCCFLLKFLLTNSLRYSKDFFGNDKLFLSDEDLSLPAPPEEGGFFFVSPPYGTDTILQTRNLEEMPIIKTLRRRRHPFNTKNIKIIISIRKQQVLLPSLYAERSSRNIHAGQKDFEEQISHFLNHYGFYLEYDQWHKTLADIVGSENVLVLPLESINSPLYWSALSEFIGSELEKPLTTRNLNTKKHHDNIWALQTPQENPCLKIEKRTREEYIQLSSDLRDIIEKHFKLSNTNAQNKIPLLKSAEEY